MVNIKSVQDSLTELFIENTEVIFEGLYSLPTKQIYVILQNSATGQCGSLQKLPQILAEHGYLFCCEIFHKQTHKCHAFAPS